MKKYITVVKYNSLSHYCVTRVGGYNKQLWLTIFIIMPNKMQKVRHYVWAYLLLLYCVPQKTCDYFFYNNFNNKCPITIIFGIVSSQSMRHRKMVSFPTLPI